MNPPTHHATDRGRQALLVLAIALLAVNLRPSVNALGAVLPELREAVGLTSLNAGILTALPTLCFALMGLLGPALVKRFGPDRSVVIALGGIVVGNLLRVSSPQFGGILAGSIIALGSMAVGNVMLPAIARKYFENRLAGITALYASMLSAGAALAAAITLPVERNLGGDWRVGLGQWAATAAVALVPWVIVTAQSHRHARAEAERHAEAHRVALASDPDAQSTAPRPIQHVSMLSIARLPHMWAMALFFAFQSANAYVVFQWIPTVLHDFGLSVEEGSANVAVVGLTTMVVSFAVPTLARKYAAPLLVTLGLAYVFGYLGLLFAPLAATVLWSVLLGIGGTLFSLSLYTISVRAQTAETTLATSTFAQAMGYLVAAAGPFAFALLHDVTGSWHLPIIVMIVTCFLDVALGFICLRHWTVEKLLRERGL
ncbi:MFS transporter [Micrococcales bacterium 31B]|nr:MFS transporter [Micrococcales bacterium 31B]